MICWMWSYICTVRTNKICFSLSIYFNNHALDVSKRLTIHHQEVFYCIQYTECGRCMINTICHIYSKIPLDVE
jgi:hypothetical protein